jgi:hypothetical protein
MSKIKYTVKLGDHVVQVKANADSDNIESISQ